MIRCENCKYWIKHPTHRKICDCKESEFYLESTFGDVECENGIFMEKESNIQQALKIQENREKYKKENERWYRLYFKEPNYYDFVAYIRGYYFSL